MDIIIVSHTEERGIGNEGKLPWEEVKAKIFDEDLAWVYNTTTRVSNKSSMNALLMGDVTYGSLPKGKRPLKERWSVVVSSDPAKFKDEHGTHKNLVCFDNINKARAFINGNKTIEHGFNFGGASMYRQLLEMGSVDVILSNKISGNFKCDTYFAEIPQNFYLVGEQTVSDEKTEITRMAHARKNLSKTELQTFDFGAAGFSNPVI